MKIRKVFVTLLFFCGILFSSCSFYEELRGNPVLKAGAVRYPQNFSAVYGEQTTGCITLIWELVENANAYEIYCMKKNNNSSVSKNYIDSNATLIYKYTIPYTQGKNAVLEISNITSGQKIFFIRSVSENNSKSDYSKKYVSFYSSYSDNKSLEFRELNDFNYTFDYTGDTVGVPFTIGFNSQWAAAVFMVEDDWASIEVEFADETDLSKIQFALISDAIESEQSWGPQYYSEYIPITSATLTINFEEWFKKNLKSTGATKIVSANIQNTLNVDKTLYVEVIEAIVTKKDGSKKSIVPDSDGWGSKIERD